MPRCEHLDGGILGMPLLAGYLGLLIWILTTAATPLRRGAAASAKPALT